VAILSALTGCVSHAAEDRRRLDHSARGFLVATAHGPVDSVLSRLYAPFDPDTVTAHLRQVADFLRPFTIDSLQLIGSNVLRVDDARVSGIMTYEGRAAGQWAVVSVALRGSTTASWITGFQVLPMPASQAEINAFTFRNRPLRSYFLLAAALLTVLICIGGAVNAARTRMGAKWILLCLVGVGKTTLNWTSGHVVFNPFAIEVLGAGAVRPAAVGPWLLSWSLPIGTVAMLAYRWRRKRAQRCAIGQAAA
jgi:hypothetical protein